MRPPGRSEFWRPRSKRLALPGESEFEHWRKSHPAIAGGAGWAVNRPVIGAAGTVAGTTGVSATFGGTVAVGDVIAAAGIYSNNTAGLTPTFADTTGNVTTWNTAGNFALMTLGFWLAISFGVATTTTAPTVKMTWNSATSANTEMWCGDFTPPAGTISQDGTLAIDNHGTSSATISTPTGNGSGTNDLVVFIAGVANTLTTINSPWAAMGPLNPTAGFSDGAGYALNSSAAIAANATQNVSGTWGSGLIAVKSVNPADNTTKAGTLGQFDPDLRPEAWF